ncbi:MAG: transglutaminase-like domain-containing protein [Polyangia bacterium]|jgi:hypothetical protein|nr:transglutaminase-like domain-containing protein [Polyangia bacterium]
MTRAFVFALIGGLALLGEAACEGPARKPSGGSQHKTDAAGKEKPEGKAALPAPEKPVGAPRGPGDPIARPGDAPSGPENPEPRPALAGQGNVLELPDAPGVTRLTSELAREAPRVDLPVDRVVAQARAHCRTHWYGLYLQGKKLGWAEMGCAVAPWQGREVVERRSRMVMEAKMYATEVKIEITSTMRFAAQGRGELLSYEYRQDGAQQRKTLSIQRGASGWTAEQTYRAGKISKPGTRRVLPELRTALGNSEMAVTTLLLEGKLTPGARYRYLELDPEDVEERESAAQLLGQAERVVQGVKTRLYKMEVMELHRKLRGETVMDSSGNWLDGSVQGTIRIRREEKATARRMDPTAGDFGLGAVIRAPMNVAEPGKVRQLRLGLTGYLPPGLEGSSRHKLTKLGPKEAELTITREPLGGLPTTLLPQLEERFPKELAATEQIESRHPEILALGRRAVAGESHALPAARKITAFVYGYLKKSLSTNLDSALAISRAKAGDCTEHARLMVALCRAVGLPARELGGVTWVPDLGGFGYHAWVEVWVGRWVSADPAWNELPANATHILMGGPEDVQWIGTLGNLKVSVLGFELEPQAAPKR